MDDKTALLNQLRIDRGSESAPSGKARGSGWRHAIGGGGHRRRAPAGGGRARPAMPVHVVAAQAVAGGAAAAGSILDASGYVVARRQATVASKITAKMVELDIEEGDHVKAGQVIAKLDDTNIRAALNQASAQLDYAKAGLAETQVNLANAQRDYERQKSLLQGHFVSQSAVDNAQTTRRCACGRSSPPSAATSRSSQRSIERGAAQSGRHRRARAVCRRRHRQGRAARRNRLADIGGRRIHPHRHRHHRRHGLAGDPGRRQRELHQPRAARSEGDAPSSTPIRTGRFPAHVIAVIPTADRSKGTVTVRVALDQKDPRILPEMGVRVSFLADAPRAAGAPADRRRDPAEPTRCRRSGANRRGFRRARRHVERRAVRLGAGGGDSDHRACPA